MKQWTTTGKTLNEVSILLELGKITSKEAQEYVEKWNNTPGRFTTAKISGYRIINVHKR
jgi:hypothetical protein